MSRRGPSGAGFSPEVLAELDRKNFSNQVYFYRVELIRISRGVSPLTILARREVRALRKRGLLKRYGAKWDLTSRARVHLDSMVTVDPRMGP